MIGRLLLAVFVIFVLLCRLFAAFGAGRMALNFFSRTSIAVKMFLPTHVPSLSWVGTRQRLR